MNSIPLFWQAYSLRLLRLLKLDIQYVVGFFLLNSKFICAENESHEVIKISLGDILNRAVLHLF